MRIRLVYKLFAAFLLMVGVSVGTLTMLTQKQLARGFLEYVNQSDQQRINTASEVLAEDYSRHGSWDFVFARRYWPELWRPLGSRQGQNQDDRARHPERAVSRPSRDPTRSGREPGRRAPASGRPQLRPQPPGPSRERRPTDRRHTAGQIGLESRVTLFDPQGARIIGRPSNPGGAARDIVVAGEVVGRLTRAPLGELSAPPDIDFVRQQARALYIAAAILILLAGLAAAWFARQIAGPIQRMAKAADNIARGRFETRVEISQRDEIGDLATRINHLSRTLLAHRDARRRWIADISHELRTPLQILRGEIESLVDGVRRVDADALRSLSEEIDDLSRLVDDLHQLTLSDLGALDYDMQEMDLVHLTARVVDRFRDRAAEASLAMTTDLIGPQPFWGDPTRLSQALSNLLDNAVKYTRAGGTIVVKLKRNGDRVALTVEDSEPAVPAADLDSLGEPLFRAGPASDQPGSGLGLAICRRIVEGHHGKLRFYSSPLGGLGSLIELPLNRGPS